MAISRFAPILFVLLALIPPASFTQDVPLGHCPCTLKGVVLNAVTGEPVRRALVESSVGSPSSTLTDSAGAFHFDDLPAGSVTLSAAKPGFLPSTPFFSPSPPFPVTPNAPAAVIKLVPGGVIRGHVSDDSDLPIENLSVRLFRRAPGSSQPVSESIAGVQTNDLGNYRFPDLSPGTYYLWVDPQGAALHIGEGGISLGYPRLYYPGVPDMASATPIKVVAGRDTFVDLPLKMLPFIRLSGKVVGAPLGTQIELVVASASSPDDAAVVRVEPATGAFRTEWIPPGSYTLFAAAEGASASPGPVGALTAVLPVNALASTSGLTLALQPAVNVPVNLSGLPQNENATGVTLFAVNTSSGNRFSATQKVTREGVNPLDKAPPAGVGSADMWFEALPPGSYHLEIVASFDQPVFVESARFGPTDLLTDDFFIDSSASSRSIDIAFSTGAASITGTANLKDASHGAVVCLMPEKSGMPPKFLHSSGAANFTFDDLAPGNYRIIAIDGLSLVDFKNPEDLKRLSSSATEIALSPGQNLQLTLDVVTLRD